MVEWRMRVLRLLAAVCLPIAGFAVCVSHAQQHEPGTGSAQVAPASKAPKQVQQPDVRLDSKPHTSLDSSLDSSLPPMDLGLGASPDIDLGHDIVPTTPPGMESRSVPGNPRMVYFSLPYRTVDNIAAADSAILASRRSELAQAAAKRGFDLKQSGWVEQQAVCPAMQPDAEAVVGVPPAEGGEGSILLHFVRHGEDGRRSAFVAVVPRAEGEPVRVNSVARNQAPKRNQARGDAAAEVLLSKKPDRAMVKQALPPATLFANMQPVKGWIPVSACVAEMQGSIVHIPNEPFLSEDIITAPPPLLRLLLNGEHKVVFTDRFEGNPYDYTVWDEHVSRSGKLVSTQHDRVKIVPRPVTNPPEPQPRMIADIPQPPVHIRPAPPSPLSGQKQ